VRGDDAFFMNRALELALEGAGLVSPNPMVGAILVKGGRIIGQGYHLYERVKHAEICALEEAGPEASGATLYSTLEPCSHYGRTPPCCEALIEAGIARAVIAMMDPNPLVNGGGLARLREAGIQVSLGICQQEAERLNEIYIKNITTRRPFFHAVIDSSGAWTPSQSFRQMARRYDAIVMGRNAQANRIVAEAMLEVPKHRSLHVIVAFEDVALPEILSRARGDGRCIEQRSQSSQVSALLELLKAETGVLILPGFEAELQRPEILRHIDKLTVISSRGEEAFAAALDSAELVEAAGLLEVTGYPSL
jgi:pyrimidine deaminase RibD-like protein